MKERPILFSGPMVRAILDGRKTMTRRIVKPQPLSGYAFADYKTDLGYPASLGRLWAGWWPSDRRDGSPIYYKCPYGQPGDRLWVRETWAEVGTLDPGFLVYRATYPECLPAGLENVPDASAVRWRPSIHMFRWASRSILEITAVRVERLHDISEEDARAEGCPPCLGLSECGGGCDCCESARPVKWFRDLWSAINGAGSWDSNPWVWSVSFNRVEAK